ncbi:hypothetical protein LWE61_08660 [Sphingobium sufflavum]|uniref:hypothetical protein n=1 Tax=Sphingobium sufflavum TaxID=1129547 RepID=UPI001F34989A|nr:hypothetical protein [Sphingobium sufflavum]MCE7796629.1 hypothetical protein [Sphingobium sufflavum]
MKADLLTAAFAILAMTTPAGAVGLGPLSDEGVIDGPRKAFSLTLYNPYEESMAFRAYAVGIDNDDETPQLRVTILPPENRLGSRQSRRLLIIANDLQPGETYRFRLCAERVNPPTGVVINARVCSKLTARRLG